MEKIGKHIFELLFQHDCVILPGLGGFVADYRSTQIDEKSKKIFPPSKSFIFNKYLVNNDGLLANKIVDSEGCVYQDAVRKIEDFVKVIQSKLVTEKRYELNEVGILYIDSAKNIRFKAVKTNFLINSFGLPVVKAIPVVQEIKVEEPAPKKVAKIKPIEIVHQKEKLPEEKKVIPIQQGKSSRRSYWWAAAVAIPVLFYSAWIPMKTDLLRDGGQFHYSDLNPFTFNKDRVYYPQDYSILEVDEVGATIDLKDQYGDENYGIYPIDDSEDFAIIKLREEITPVAETTFVEKKKVVKTERIEHGYHLIGGCFGKMKNANAFIKKMKKKGYNAFILDQNKGLHRVSISQFESRSDAKELKSELKREDLSTWILKK